MRVTDPKWVKLIPQKIFSQVKDFDSDDVYDYFIQVVRSKHDYVLLVIFADQICGLVWCGVSPLSKSLDLKLASFLPKVKDMKWIFQQYVVPLARSLGCVQVRIETERPKACERRYGFKPIQTIMTYEVTNGK